MCSKKLVICEASEENKEYAHRLAAFLASRPELSFQVKTCEDKEQVFALQKEAGIDVLLVDEKIAGKKSDFPGIPYVFLLTEKLRTDEKARSPTIFRYQSGEDILTRLIETVAAKGTGDFWGIKKKTKGQIIGVYSPVKRLGQSAFALKKGKELSKNENVLYINLEDYAGIGGYFPENEKNLSSLLYFACQESGNCGLLVATLIKQIDGLDYIPPVLFPEDLKNVTAEEWLRLFADILSHSIYDVLILDIGDSIRGIPQILKVCDTIYMPSAADKMAVSKIYQFEEMLCRQGYGEVWERVIHCDIRRTAKDKNLKGAGSDKRSGGR